MRLEFTIVNVFTDQPFGGNPLAVFEAGGEALSDAQMQAIARQMNLSETTFVTPTDRSDCDVRLRIFTPTQEVPMAGHPTVGTAFVLDRGSQIVFEEGVGPIPVQRVQRDGPVTWRMTQPVAGFHEPIKARQTVARALGLPEAALAPELPVQPVVTGVPFVVVPLVDLDALARIELDRVAWSEIRGSAEGLYPFARVDEHTLRARMVGCPGIEEDPATGSAAGPLGAYARRYGVHEGPVRVQQGVEMGRPSLIEVQVDGPAQRLQGPTVAGTCFALGRGELRW